MGEELQTASPETWARETWSKGLDILGLWVKNATAKEPTPTAVTSTTPSWLNAKNIVIGLVGIVALIWVMKKI